jgi:hypothetical protein
VVRSPRLARWAAVAALVACGACGSDDSSTGPPGHDGGSTAQGGSTPERESFPAYAATATVDVVEVHDRPAGAVVHRLDHPQSSGAPLVFLVEQRSDGRPGWLQVHLPVRPNGSTGWVRAEEVRVQGLAHRLEVRVGDRELDLYEHGVLVRTFPVGIGRADTPTPGGVFYLKELLEPPDPDGAYGPYAFGLSGFSATLESFAGGEAVIGLHGTDDPASVGRETSSGCIRLRNEDITELARTLPLGTPVEISA